MAKWLPINPKRLLDELGITRVVEMAFIDPLTGLPNRNRLVVAEKRRRRAGQRTVYVRVDLDGFKVAQDTPGLGHEWGNKVLVGFANYARMHIRDELIGREGGDEFIVLADSYAGAGRIAEVLSMWNYKATTRQGRQVVVGASVGIGLTPKAADHALYEAKRWKKRQGRGWWLRALWRRLRGSRRAA